jgi:outer membrane biosynthesis protein TonB
LSAASTLPPGIAATTFLDGIVNTFVSAGLRLAFLALSPYLTRADETPDLAAVEARLFALGIRRHLLGPGRWRRPDCKHSVWANSGARQRFSRETQSLELIMAPLPQTEPVTPPSTPRKEPEPTPQPAETPPPQPNPEPDPFQPDWPKTRPLPPPKARA